MFDLIIFGIFLLFVGTVIFLLVTCLLAFIKGQDEYKGGFVVVGAALLFLCLTSGYLLNWVRKEENLDNKIKYVAAGQTAALAFLCVAIVVTLFGSTCPAPITCPTCQTCPGCSTCCPVCPPNCDLLGYYNQNQCVVLGMSSCFNNEKNPPPIYFNVDTNITGCLARQCRVNTTGMFT